VNKLLSNFLFVLFIVVFNLFSVKVHAQITYVASSTTPADGVTTNTSPVTVTPPGGLQAGDLVLVFAHNRNTTATYTISTTGGQVWNTEARIGATNLGASLFWCRFNGTWTGGNPAIAYSANAGNMVVMHVFRPTKPSLRWAIEAARTELDYATPASPFTVTITGRTTRVPSSVTIAAWFSIDNNSWGTLAGTGWTVLGGAQYRNGSGTGNSSTYAYNIKSVAGATNNVSKNQTALGGDAGTTMIITFFEMAHGMSALLL